VGTGLVVEVEDRGLGLSPDELDDINARLAGPAEFDLAHSEQLGLFVVSRLAARHAIKVSLRRSVYGGTLAVVLMPFGVVVRQEEASLVAPRGDRPADSGPRGLTGRHRLPPAVAAGPGTGARNGEAEWPMAPWETGPIALPSEPQAPPSLSSPPSLPASLSPPTAGMARTGRAPARAPWETEPGMPGAEPAGSMPASSGPASSGPAGSGPAGSHLGMPIRVPQASLTPQLRARPGTDQQVPRVAEDEAPGFGARSPEATRNMLTMMQLGWRRGRVDDLDDPGGAPGTGTD
jgi:hypothetical protein